MDKLKGYLLTVICVAVLAAALAVAVFSPARAEGGAVAIVDGVRVIAASTPGREAQQRYDAYRAAIDAQRAAYAKSVAGKPDAVALVDKRDVEFNAKNSAEFQRLSAIMAGELRKAAQKWLEANGKARGVDVIVSAAGVMSAAPGAKTVDASEEVLAILNAAYVNLEK